MWQNKTQKIAAMDTCLQERMLGLEHRVTPTNLTGGVRLGSNRTCLDKSLRCSGSKLTLRGKKSTSFTFL